MKIFNWVHRKFHSKDGWNVEVTKKAEHDTHTLIEQVDLSGVIDSWKQGILAIGTFGYDPLKDFTQLIANNDQELEDEEEEEEYYDEQLSYVESCDDEEEFDRDHNPLVLHAFKHAFNTTTNASHCDQNTTNAQESEIVFAVADADESNNYLAFDEKKKGKRITLADLFSADCDEYNTSTKQPYDHGDDDDDDHGKVVQPEQIKKRPDEKHARAKLSFAKKLIPRVKEDSDSHSRPIKKIHRMMTRMLKRKIHPELEGKNQMKHSENGANEMVSLLQTQDATVCA